MSYFKWKENLNGKGIGLPDTFKCRICTKVKPSTNDHYSKKELKTYTSRVTMGKTITGFSANLRCRHCSGENVFELLCQNCHITKSKDDFSYNQRTAALSARCKACVNWTETNEPGTETLPGPSMALHPDTTLADVSNFQNPGIVLSVLASSANEGTDDGDEVAYPPSQSAATTTNLLPQSSVWRTTHPSNNTMGIPTNVSAGRTIERPSVVGSGHPSAPPGFMAPTRMTYLGEPARTESTPSNPYASRPSSTVSDATNIFAQFDPFAHRGAKTGQTNNAGGFKAIAASSADSEAVGGDDSSGNMWMTPKKKATETTGYDAFDSPTTTPAPGNHDVWTTVPNNNKKAFTGYDNQGKAHLETAISPSTASGTWATTAASVTASTVFNDAVASGKYGKPRRNMPRGNTTGDWFKASKPAKGDTMDYKFEDYAPADLAEHAPPKKRAENNGWESDDEM
ncbi:hypothetical protein V493_04334 [Pseudogymnoascus sp. VKM F-4281 (FW-2241)]|nr:hypothetical protein V493_04334 [Pseudogymnoascus sp. VKM F-4281 (FW-2241)]